MTVITSEAIIAVVKDSILNPSISFEAKISRTAFITKRNKPKLRIVAGRVKRISRGLIKMFRIARTRATITAVVYESILNPGTIYAVRRRMRARIKRSTRNFIKVL